MAQFMIITDKDCKQVMDALTEKRIWVEDIQNQTDLPKLLADNKATSYKTSEVMGVFVPEEKKPKMKPVEQISYKKNHLDGWKSVGVKLAPHPVGFAIVVLNKTKRNKRLSRKTKRYIHIFDIDWNTDGELIDDLPQEMVVDDDGEEFVDDDGEINNGLISDWLSDRKGWLVNSFSWEVC